MGNGTHDAIPRKRTKDLVIRAHGEETLVLDRRTATVHCLPAEVTRVWDACTGSNTLTEIAAAANVNEQIAASAVDQLLLLDLLEHHARFDRRKFLRRSALVGGGALMLPVIESVVAAPAAMAQSRPGMLNISAVCGVGGVASQTGWVVTFPANTGWDANTPYLVTVAVNGGPSSSAELMTGTGGAGTTDPNGTPIGNPGQFPNPVTVTVTVTNTRTPQDTFTFEKELATAAGAGCPLVRAQRAYVANSLNGTVSVIETASNTITATIDVDVGNNTLRRVAAAPDSSRVYATYGSATAGNVAVIDTTKNTVIETITVGNNPFGVAVSPDGGRVYVTNASGNSVSVIDTTASPPAVTTITGIGALPVAIALAPLIDRAYTANNSGNSVSVINTAVSPPAVTTTITGVGTTPYDVAVNPANTSAYVTLSPTTTTGHGVRVINTTGNTLGATINTTNSSAPHGVAVAPDGSRLYVALFGMARLQVINTPGNTLGPSVTVGTAPEFVAVTPDGSRAYVSNFGTGTGTTGAGTTVSVINTAASTPTVTATITGFSRPAGIAIAMPIV